ncbi:MAG: 6-phosphofructokinase [Polyangia bacterium]
MKLRPGARIGILTSGGDAPGMNAALRSAARVSRALGLELVGIDDGYVGLLAGHTRALDMRALDENARRGGTLLGSARSKVFPTAEGQIEARRRVVEMRISALLVIGGNGSLTGARAIMGAPTHEGDALLVGGLPASIDNDLGCTSMAIGTDTAMNTIIEACDRICDTATAHRRTFIIEVMGRDCGYLAMTAAVAAGADAVLVREAGRTDEQLVEQVCRAMELAYRRDTGKRRVMVIKAEGVKLDVQKLKAAIDARMEHVIPDVDTRVTVLGHVVRGGTPSAFDRLLGARLAHAAVRGLADGETGFMAGWFGPGITRAACPYDPYVILSPLDEMLAETAKILDGSSPLAQWRRRIFEESEGMLAQ